MSNLLFTLLTVVYFLKRVTFREKIDFIMFSVAKEKERLRVISF